MAEFYTVSKRMEIAGSHKLRLDYESKCENLHGHNWIITVKVGAPQVNTNGMVADFTEIKKYVHDKLDHQNLNDVVPFNPTAENIAAWVFDTLNTHFKSSGSKARCLKIEVQESEGNIATYEVIR